MYGNTQWRYKQVRHHTGDDLIIELTKVHQRLINETSFLKVLIALKTLSIGQDSWVILVSLFFNIVDPSRRKDVSVTWRTSQHPRSLK